MTLAKKPILTHDSSTFQSIINHYFIIYSGLSNQNYHKVH